MRRKLLFTKWRSATALAALSLVVACSDDSESPTRPDVLSLTPTANHVTTPAFTWDGANSPGTDIRTNGLYNINGGIWDAIFPLGTGSGNLDPFLTFANDPEEHGFNTDGPLQLDDQRTQYTDALPLNVVPIFSETVGGFGSGPWREFILDANENNSAPNPQFSIEAMDIYVCRDATTPTAPATYTAAQFQAAITAGTCVRVYNIDDNGHNSLLASDAGTSGSGKTLDYRILIPASNFGSAANAACPYNADADNPCGYYVILYSHMGGLGGDYTTGSTYEEFSTVKRPVPATITIIKDAVPNDAQDFAYSTTGGLTPATFSLDDDSDLTLSNTQVIGNVAAGSYSVTEGTDPTGWDFTSLTCTSTGTGTSVTTSGKTANITAAEGGTVTCTYVNTQELGTITIIKNSVGDNGTFQYTTTGGAPVADFSITTASNTGQQVFNNVPAGNYSVTESGPPAGWDFVSLSCSTGGTVASQTANIVLPAGGSVTCTYTNRKQGTITIIKNAVGGDDTFAYTTTGAAPVAAFNITTSSGTGQKVFTGVSAGNYSVTESGPPAGWEFTSLTCSTGGTVSSQTANIVLPAGGSVTCTYTNTKPVHAQIAPTATTCTDFLNETSADLAPILATMSKNTRTVNSLAPGVFFYYAEVTKTAGQAIGFKETVTPAAGISSFPLYPVQQEQAYIYGISGSSCTSPLESMTQSTSDPLRWSGGASLPAGTYIIGIKFSPSDVTPINLGVNTSPDQLLATHFFNITIAGADAGGSKSITTRTKP